MSMSIRFVVLAISATHVAEVDEIQFLVHACNGRRGQIGSVHQTDAVHKTAGDNETSVDAMDDLALFCRRELWVIVDGLFGVRREGFFELGWLRLLERSPGDLFSWLRRHIGCRGIPERGNLRLGCWVDTWGRICSRLRDMTRSYKVFIVLIFRSSTNPVISLPSRKWPGNGGESLAHRDQGGARTR